VDTWVVLGLGCALGTAIADVLTKQSAGGRDLHAAILTRTLLPALLLLPLLFWLGWPQIEAEAAIWLALAWPLEVLALNWYIDAVRCGVLARTLPFLALTPAISFLAAFLLLGERLSQATAAGVLLVVGGCYLAYRGESKRVEGPLPTEAAGAMDESDRRSRSRAIRLMAGVAAIYALTPVLAKAAMRGGNPFAFGIFYYAAVAGLSAVAILLRKPRAWCALRELRRVDWAIGVCIAVVVLMHYAALQLAAVPAFLALKRLSIVFAAVLGALVLHEVRGWAFWAPSLLAVAGAGLIVVR